MQDDPAVFRKKLLEKLPPESSIIAINKLLAEITVEGDKINGHYRDGLCKRTLNELSCGFPIREFWWGYKKSGFNLYFTLDGSDRLKDVRVSRYSVWFGE
jgi:hypothetical protein